MKTMTLPKHHFLEFFAGAGMARIGLGPRWHCLYANDIDPTKTAAYRANFRPADELHQGDIAAVSPETLPDGAVLAWASFPCQDLSLAGNGAGLNGGRSGTFWHFSRLIHGMAGQKRAPVLVAIENVVGTLSSHGGRDFTAIIDTLSGIGYRVGALVIDAVHFVPQSRPRVFIVGQLDTLPIPAQLQLPGPDGIWHSGAVKRAYGCLPPPLQSRWVWWNVPEPQSTPAALTAIIEDEPASVPWNDSDQTAYLLSMMSPVNLAKVQSVAKLGTPVVGTVYRRTRKSPDGKRMQRAEVRFDNIAGCLRTPTGGSSRQTLLFVNGESIRSRLLSSREAARLMGLPEGYKLPSNYNETYHLAGDGVAVPVVRHLSRTLLTPLADQANLLGFEDAASHGKQA
ncbi:MAG: DNA cytosine methyltransferase [Thermoflexales bacterium]